MCKVQDNTGDNSQKQRAVLPPTNLGTSAREAPLIQPDISSDRFVFLLLEYITLNERLYSTCCSVAREGHSESKDRIRTKHNKIHCPISSAS